MYYCTLNLKGGHLGGHASNSYFPLRLDSLQSMRIPTGTTNGLQLSIYFIMVFVNSSNVNASIKTCMSMDTRRSLLFDFYFIRKSAVKPCRKFGEAWDITFIPSHTSPIIFLMWLVHLKIKHVDALKQFDFGIFDEYI